MNYTGYYINANFFYFLILLMVGLGSTAAILGYVLLRRRSVATWRPGHQNGCCLDESCSAECANRLQAIHSARYEDGLRDAIAYPNRVQELIHQGRRLDPGYHPQLDGGYHPQLDPGYHRELGGGYGSEPDPGYHRELGGGYGSEPASPLRRPGARRSA